MKKTLAIYPGSFNPFTVGHQDVLEKAEKIFGKENVIVSVGVNPDKIDKFTLGNKTHEVYSNDDSRVKTIEGQLPSKTVEGYHCFLTEYVRLKREETGCEVVVIRGLRNGHDFDYEYNQIRHMWDQMPELNVMCLFADPINMHVSSSAYRAMEKMKNGAGHHMLAIDRKNPRL